MTSSLRDLGSRAESVSAPQLDVARLVAAGESRIRRRRVAAIAAVTAAVLVIVGGALVADTGDRETAPPPGQNHSKTDEKTNDNVDVVQSRLLTYATGPVIHWGEERINVRQQTTRSPGQGELVDYLDATDDGVVFIVGLPFVHDNAGGGLPYGPAQVWFTKGAAPVRIGTTYGSRIRGFEIVPTAAGSTLAWLDPGTKTSRGGVVVYDTAQMKPLARLGDGRSLPLAAYDDAVYWTPDGRACERYLPSGAGYRCKATAQIMRFDRATGGSSPVTMDAYVADRRSRPGLLTGTSTDAQIRRGVEFLSFVPRGERLVAVGTWHDTEPPFGSTVAMTGKPLRLHHPARTARTARADEPALLQMMQWLDADRVVLIDSDDDRVDLLECRLSTGDCRVVDAITGRDFNASGPVVTHG